MKNIEWVVNFLVKLIILVLFVLFSFYRMEKNLLVITVVLLLFSFINSFIIENKRIKFDFEIFSFQAIAVFYLERKGIFYWREVSEGIFDNYDYIKLLFIAVFIIVFIFLFFKSKNKFLKRYFYCISLSLVMIQNIFEIEPAIPMMEHFIFGLIYFVLSTWEAIFCHFRIDIAIIAVLAYFLVRKDKKFLYVYFFIVLCFFIRHLTENFS